MKMIKKIPFILSLAAAICLCGCKEDKLKTYSGDNYLHFKPGADDKVVAEYNFAKGETTREMEYNLPVDLRIWGFLPEEDFNFTTEIVAEGTTATSSDYVLQPVQVFKAGEPEGKFHIKVKRSEEILKTDYSIVVRIVSAENGHVVAPAAYSRLSIRVRDELDSVEPKWWGTTSDLGPYSVVKFRLFNIYLGRFLDSLDGYSSISFKKEALSFKTWWKEQWIQGKYHYFSDDGTTPLYESIPD